ncbi:MAG: AEC family transporter [candidate division KSB1 bacterium]|nr:AEC family transporter [candidate division KSB1 bacterium]
MNLIQQFGFTVNAVAPVFFLVFMGIALKKWNVTNDTFNRTGSLVVFRVALPALVFERIAFTEFSEVFNGKLIGFVLAATLLWTLLMTVYAILLQCDGRDTGVFIQGSYRSNFAIIGMALIYNVLGDTALSKAAIILAVLMPVFNILAILALTLPQHKEKVSIRFRQ